MNRITVNPRFAALDNVYIAKHNDDDEQVFMKDRSVFKDYREDDEKFLKECYEEDLWFGKINKVFRKDPEEYERVKTFLFDHYVRLMNIFHYYSGMSDYPVISMNDVTNFAHQCNILDPNYVKLAEMDLLLISSNVVHHTYLKSEERNL